MKTYIVVGLGRFGSSVAAKLCELGNEVMVMDVRQNLVQKISPAVTTAVTGDARDLEVLRSLGVQNFDGAVVAVGTDLATNVLVTLNLKELGVPVVICKAQDEMQKRALEKIGADRVVIPERETGIKLAQQLTSTSVLDFIELSPEFGIAEIAAMPEWKNKTIVQTDIRAKLGLNIIAVKRGEEIIVSPAAAFMIEEEDIIVVLGRNIDLARVREAR